jgi:hypothetical protein
VTSERRPLELPPLGEVGSARAAPGGWPLVGQLGAGVACVLAVSLLWGGANEAGLRGAVRAVGACSLALFLAAYTARPLERLFPSRATRWQRANRRYLGVSFGLSHLLHACAVAALHGVAQTPVSAQLGVPLVLLLLVGYGFVLAMLATSFDRTAAWLGPRRWHALHAVGLHYLWVLFLVAYLRPVRGSPVYLIPITLLLGALALRLRAARLPAAP